MGTPGASVGLGGAVKSSWACERCGDHTRVYSPAGGPEGPGGSALGSGGGAACTGSAGSPGRLSPGCSGRQPRGELPLLPRASRAAARAAAPPCEGPARCCRGCVRASWCWEAAVSRRLHWLRSPFPRPPIRERGALSPWRDLPRSLADEHTPALWPLLVLPAHASPTLGRPACGCEVTEMLQGSPSCAWCQSGSTLRASGFCCVCRKHLQEIPSSSTNVSTSLEWDSGKTSELLSSMGVSALKKDKLGNENTPQDLLVSSSCLPPKRQKVKDNEKDFVIVRRPWLLQEAESGTVTLAQVLPTLQ